MSITPLDSSYDESAGFGTLDTNCMTEGGPDFVFSSNMQNDWTFTEDIAVLITPQRGKGDDVMAARVHGGYTIYVGMMVKKHNKYGQRMKDGDD
eukprot:13208043-Ditylum_brightwellii.AAC.1